MQGGGRVGEEREGRKEERERERERDLTTYVTCDYKGNAAYSLPYVHNIITTSAISSPYSNLVPLAPVLHHSTAHFI
jgi:hypothetical protein